MFWHVFVLVVLAWWFGFLQSVDCGRKYWWTSAIVFLLAQTSGWRFLGHSPSWAFGVGGAAVVCFVLDWWFGRYPDHNPALTSRRCALQLTAILLLTAYWIVAAFQQCGTPRYSDARLGRLFVCGTARDLGYLAGRDIDAAPQAEWNPTRDVERQDGLITRTGFDDLRAGYTLVLARKPKGTGWLPVKRLTAEAREELREVLRRQGVADQRHFAGHWVDPTSGKLMPYRFYQPDGSTEVVRVVGGDIQYGPQGEEVFDISLYHNRPEFVVEVRRQHLHPEAPYIGRAGPEKPWRPW